MRQQDRFKVRASGSDARTEIHATALRSAYLNLPGSSKPRLFYPKTVARKRQCCSASMVNMAASNNWRV